MLSKRDPKIVSNPCRTERTTRRTAPASASTAVRDEAVADEDQHLGQEAWIGTDSNDVSNGNVSWGAIFVGVVTFLAIMILLGVGAAAMGLQGSGGLATGTVAETAGNAANVTRQDAEDASTRTGQHQPGGH